MTGEQIKTELQKLAQDEKFRQFTVKLTPTAVPILGVRLPQLRKLAAQMGKEDWKRNLEALTQDSFEEIMLQGMVIGTVRGVPFAVIVEELEKFIPKIDNWSVCDSCCAGLKIAKEEPETVWEFLQPYLNSEKEFEVRFAVVMLLFYFVDEAHIDRLFLIFDRIRQEGYYSRMAVAWAVSVCFIHFPGKTWDYLRENRLDEFTYRKALQKITESFQVEKGEKARIRALRRK